MPDAEGAEERKEEKTAVGQEPLPRPARAELVHDAAAVPERVEARTISAVGGADAEAQVGEPAKQGGGFKKTRGDASDLIGRFARSPYPYAAHWPVIGGSVTSRFDCDCDTRQHKAVYAAEKEKTGGLFVAERRGKWGQICRGGIGRCGDLRTKPMRAGEGGVGHPA